MSFWKSRKCRLSAGLGRFALVLLPNFAVTEAAGPHWGRLTWVAVALAAAGLLAGCCLGKRRNPRG